MTEITLSTRIHFGRDNQIKFADKEHRFMVHSGMPADEATFLTGVILGCMFDVCVQNSHGTYFDTSFVVDEIERTDRGWLFATSTGSVKGYFQYRGGEKVGYLVGSSSGRL